MNGINASRLIETRIPREFTPLTAMCRAASLRRQDREVALSPQKQRLNSINPQDSIETRVHGN